MTRRLIAAFIAVAACIGTARAAESIVLSLNWLPYGLHYGVFAAQERGYYEEAGFDIDIRRGYGSGDTVKRVATGAADFGLAGAPSVIVGRSRGLGVKQTAIILARSGDAVYFVKGRGITEPKDLEGRTLGARVGELPLVLLPAFAANAGFDVDKLKIINMTPPSKFPSLVTGKIDSTITIVTEEPALRGAASKAGLEIGRFLFSDYGIDFYSVGLIASDEKIENKPEQVRRFVEATMRGYAWAIEHPEAAADIFAEAFPESSRNLNLAQWRITMKHIITDTTKEKGLGYIDEEKMAKTVALIEKYQGLDADVEARDVYSMDFLPHIPVH